jgi:hypothetical protein
VKKRYGVVFLASLCALVGLLAGPATGVEITGTVPDSSGNYSVCNVRQQNLVPKTGSGKSALIEASCNWGGSVTPTAMRLRYRMIAGGQIFTDGFGTGALVSPSVTASDYEQPPEPNQSGTVHTPSIKRSYGAMIADFGTSYPAEIVGVELFFSGAYRTGRIDEVIPSRLQIFYPTDYYTGGQAGGATPCLVKSWIGPDATASQTLGDPWSSVITFYPSGTPVKEPPRATIRYSPGGDPTTSDPTIMSLPAPLGVHDVNFDWPETGTPWFLRLRVVCKWVDVNGVSQSKILTYAAANYDVTAVERRFSLSECLSGAGIGFNPSSWVPGLIKSGGCLLRWAFIPESNPFDGLRQAWEGSGASVVALPVSIINSGFDSLENGWASRDSSCTGPTANVPMGPLGGTFTMQPLKTCDGPMETVSGMVKPLSTIAFALLGLFTCVRLLLGAFGMYGAPAPPEVAT